MNGIEVIALIIALVAIIKAVIFIFNKKALSGKVEKFMKNPGLLILILFVLAILVFGYVIDSITIVQMFAAMAFYALLTALTFAAYPSHISKFTKEILNEKTPLLVKLVIVVWVILSIWVIVEVLA